MRQRRRPSGSDTLASFADSGLDPQAAQRQRDIEALKQLADNTELRPDESDAFCDMLERLDRGRYPLTDKQRKWVLSRCEELGIDVDATSPAERNANVPRGREVQTPPVLQSLPKAPPGRGSGYGAGALQALAQDQRGALVTGKNGPTKAKTQLERARAIAGELSPPLTDQLISSLEEILAAAQNPRPDGDSDGSFTTQTWDALRVLIDLLRDVQKCNEILQGRAKQDRTPSFTDDPVDMDDIPF